MNDDMLLHYGVLGMKWGVRRYQNYDGSYTKKGLQRYYKAEDEHRDAKDSLTRAKENKKAGIGGRQEIKIAKAETKLKKEMESAYKKLKRDKLADEGKKLYASGKTISGNSKMTAITEAVIVLGGNIVSSLLYSQTGNTSLASITGNTIALGGTAVNAILTAKTNSENRKLRAFYAH